MWCIEKGNVSFLALQKKLNDIYRLETPKTTLRYLLEKLQQEGKLEFRDRKTIIPSKSKLNKDFWEKRSEKEAVVEDFFLEFNSFLVKNDIQIPMLEIKEQCCRWLYMHSLGLASFVNRGKLEINKEADKWQYADKLVLFLLEIQAKKSRLFETFLQLYDGAVQASLLNFEPDKITGICESALQISNVILDTNFILRILNLQSEYDVSIALETTDCLKGLGIQFIVLEQTIDEIITSIKNFVTEIQPYSVHTRAFLQGSRIRMTGFWDAHRRGVSRAEFLELINREKLKEALLKHLDVTFVGDYDDSVITKDRIDSLILSKNRDGYSEKQARHDLSLIEYCKKNRKKRIADITEADWWVLTNDERLTYWNQTNNGVFQECITETQLSNLIWLKKKRPENCGLTQTIVALSSNTAITPQGISAFAAKVQYYQQKYKDNNKKLDNLSIIFASAMLTSNDIRRINTEEDALDKVIEEKVLQYNLDERDKQQKLANATDENSKLISENSELRGTIDTISKQLQKEKLGRQIDFFKQSLNEAHDGIIVQKSTLIIYKKMQSFLVQREKSTSRILCLMIAVPILALIILYAKLGFPLAANILQKINQLSGFIQNLLSSVPFLLITVVYYFVIVLIFGAPMPPNKLFMTLQSKLLQFRLRGFMRSEAIPDTYYSGNIESEIFSTEQEIEKLNHRISSFNIELQQLECQSEIKADA